MPANIIPKSANNHHDTVETIGLRKLWDKVHRDLLPALGRCFSRLELPNWKMPIWFGALADLTGARILPNITRHLRPPVVSTDKLKGLEPAFVAGNP